MINSIKLAGLRNNAFLQFLKDCLSIITANNPTLLKVIDQYSALQVIEAALEIMFMPQRANSMTEELAGLDLRRDNAITGIIMNSQSFTYYYDENIRLAANLLSGYFANYGGSIARLDYASETATITNVVTDLTNKPDLSATVATLGLADWITELDTSNKLFNQKYLARTQDMVAASADTMKAKRLEAANAYYALRDNLSAYFTITKGAEPFATTINQLNVLIDQYNKLITGRNSGDAPTPPPTETPVA